MTQEAPEPGSTLLSRIVLAIGATGLLTAMVVGALAVLCRHLRIPFLGSLELVQAAMVVASAGALAQATLGRRHAAARLVVDRVGPRAAAVLGRGNHVLTILFLAALAAGEIWVTSDLWHSYEESELLHIPYRPLRLLSIAAVVMPALILLRRLFTRARS